MTGAPLVGQAEQELLRVVALGAHHGAAALAGKPEKGDVGIARHHDAGSPRLDGSGGVVVAIDILAEKRHEDRAGANFSRVDLDRAGNACAWRSLEQLRPRCDHEVFDVHGKHRSP